MALLPLLTLLVLARKGEHRDASFWWLASAFALSWVADVAALFTNAWLISATYPLSQAVLVSAVFLPRPQVMGFLLSLCAVGAYAIWIFGVDGPTIPFRFVAWGWLSYMVMGFYGVPFRSAILVYFGLGLFAWAAYMFTPSYATWLGYQSTRLLGLLLFVRCTWRGTPRLVLA